MEDPNRPVTGYPAPNPNSYPQNPPPPAGTAYPYVAAPPPNAYYTNTYVQQPDRESLRRATCLRRIFAFIIGLIVLFGTVTLIVWLVLRPKLPEFRVDAFSLSNFTIDGNSSLVSFNSVVNLTARNPNKKMTLSYDRIDAVIFYRSESLSETNLPPFDQGTRSETSVTAKFAAAGSFVGKSAAEGMNSERSGSGNVVFNLRMLSIVEFEAKAWKNTRRYLKVFCGDLAVSIPANGSIGALIGGSRQCRVGI